MYLESQKLFWLFEKPKSVKDITLEVLEGKKREKSIFKIRKERVSSDSEIRQGTDVSGFCGAPETCGTA